MGKFDTHGGHFAPEGYTKVDAGGSHEENPNGGVQLGVDPQGIPNLLEEGEPVYDDYVYSDNIKADEKSLSEHGIPTKYAGKLYSEIADAFVDEAAERPLDDISNRGLQAMLSRLADAQDAQKARKEMRSLKYSAKQMSADDLQMLEDAFAQQSVPTAEAQPQETHEPQIPVEETTMPQETPQVLPDLGMNPMKDGGKVNTFEAGGDTAPGFWANLIARANDMEGTSPYTNEKAQAIANGDVEALKAVEDKEAALARTALAGQAVALGGVGMGLRALTPGAGMPLEGAPATAGAAAEAKNLVQAMQAGAESTYSQAMRNSIMQKYGLSESAMNDLMANALRDIQAEAMTSGSGFANAVVSAKEAAGNALRSGWNAVKSALPKNAAKGFRKVIGKTVAGQYGIAPASWILNNTLLRNAPGVIKAAAGYGDALASTLWPGYIPLTINAVQGSKEDKAITERNAEESTDTVANNALFPFDVDENGNLIPVNQKADGGNIYKRGGHSDTSTTTQQWNKTRFDAMREAASGYPLAPIQLPGVIVGVSEPSLVGILDSTPQRVSIEMPGVAIGPSELQEDTQRGWAQQRRDSASMPLTNPISQPGVPVPGGSGLAVSQAQPVPDAGQERRSRPATTSAPTGDTTGEGTGHIPVFSTFSQYAGPLMNGALALYNAAQRPTRFTYQRQRPALPTGHIDLIDPIYRPVDQNMSVNDVLAGGAGTTRQIANSGMGPSTAAALLAADRNIGRNLGTARTQVAGYNNQLLNGVIGQRNQNASARAQFDYGINQARAQILNNAQAQNAQMDLYTQRLNDAAETQKYSAIQSQLNGIAKALSGIGRQNVALNRLNSNRALYDIAFPNGVSGYVGQKEERFGGKIEKTKKR